MYDKIYEYIYIYVVLALKQQYWNSYEGLVIKCQTSKHWYHKGTLQ